MRGSVTRGCRAARAAWLGVLLALAGCGSSPKTHFQALVGVPPAQPSAGSSSGPVLQVGQVQLPGVLDRQSMVTRGPGTEVHVSDQDRWAAPLDELTRRALTDDLRTRLGAGRVIAPGDKAPRGARTLVVNVQQFSADPTGRVTLEADWSLQSDTGQPSGGPHHELLHVNAGSPDGSAVAQAMSTALGQLADRIAAAV